MKIKFTIPNAVNAGLSVTVPESVSAKLKGYISRGIAALEVDENGHLIITLTDGAVEDLGKVSGDDGVSVTHEWDGTVLRVTSASGTSEADLKGEDGYTPVKGKDYFDGRDGKDGVSASHAWNGTVLTMTSASGTSSADLKGDKGDTGVYVGNEEPDDSVLVWFDEDNDDALDQRVQESINEALAYAKESGEFDGTDGRDGVDGYTPVRGTDYWTEADIAEIKGYVDDAILGGAW